MDLTHPTYNTPQDAVHRTLTVGDRTIVQVLFEDLVAGRPLLLSPKDSHRTIAERCLGDLRRSSDDSDGPVEST